VDEPEGSDEPGGNDEPEGKGEPNSEAATSPKAMASPKARNNNLSAEMKANAAEAHRRRAKRAVQA